MTKKIIIAMCAVPDPDTADLLSKGLLESRLSACVSRVAQVRSEYWWRGVIERSEEILLIIKTTPEQIEPIKQFVLENHPYETPELIFLNAEDALSAYADWVRSETQQPRQFTRNA